MRPSLTMRPVSALFQLMVLSLSLCAGLDRSPSCGPLLNPNHCRPACTFQITRSEMNQSQLRMPKAPPWFW